MSLAVWLPLNGDLHNQGLSNITVTNNGATLNDNGKIGKCYSFSGSNSISINTVILPSQAPQWSFSCWFNLNDITTTTAECLFSERGGGNANGYTIFLYPSSGQILVDDGVRWSTTPMTYTANIWYHLVVTRNTSGKKLYINGQLKSQTTTVGNTTAINNNGCLIGLAQSGSSLISGNQGWKGKLNDVRIYDHALSAKEVKEIAKGLVLHYKLDQPNQNLLTNDWDLTTWSKESGISVSWDNTIGMYKVLDSSHTSSRWGIYQNITLSANTTYTFSVDGMKKDQNVNFGFAEGTSWPANAGSFTTTMSRLSKTITVGDADANCRIYLNINPVTDGSNYGYFRAPKLEIGSVATNWKAHTENIIYDSSGYGNDGTITGNLTTDNNSIRYGVTTVFPSGGYIRVEKRPAICLPKDAITVNLWQYATSWSNPISCTEGGGWNFENSNGIRFPVYISGIGYKVAQSSITPASTLNNWHMLTGTMDQDNIKIYYDGEEVGTVAKGSTNGIGYANNYLFIGAEAAGNTTTPAASAYAGNLSDVRIYATALTPEQIKELYNTSMSIDDKGNIHARELVE